MKQVFLFPSFRTKDGTGHRYRCQQLELSKEFPCSIRATNDELPKNSICILDMRKTSASLIGRLKSNRNILLALDEGAFHQRNKIDYIIDIIPGRKNIDINEFRPDLLELPQRPPVHDTQISLEKSILVYFGLHDLAKIKRFKKAFQFFLETAGWQVHYVEGFIENMKNHLARQQVVITHFGITAFQAASVGAKVLLINPSRYHEKLARNCGFRTSTFRKFKKRFFELSILGPTPELSSLTRTMQRSQIGLSEYMKQFDRTLSTACSFCNSHNVKVLYREAARSFYRCQTCGGIFQKLFISNSTLYDGEYFFSEYKEQYGKTYLEDFDHIKKMGLQRIARLSTLVHVVGKKVLDIGAAFGPFLAAAAESSMEPFGIDVSGDAVEYVREQLKFSAVQLNFEETSATVIKSFCEADIVTMWYVIEHFVNLADILKKVAEILPAGGIFAFSTPNGSGISARKKLKMFLSQSPKDHYGILTPRHTKHILRAAGFKVRRIHSTGHHTDRFPKVMRMILGSGTLLRRISDFFCLGDTFEVYAEKVSE